MYAIRSYYDAYNESVRVPLMVADLRKPSTGRMDTHIALNVDIAPTILDYAGISIPKNMQGKSLVPLVEGKQVRWRSAFYYEHFFPNAAIPKSEAIIALDYKYIYYPDFKYEALYNEVDDPKEINNLASDPKYKSRINKMRKTLATASYNFV